MSNINGDAGTDAMAAALTDAAGDLETIANENLQLQHNFEAQGWAGMDVLAAARSTIDTVRDNLTLVAERIGVGGQIVRDAHLANHMITNASKASLGHS